jgi:hypothetical protein
MATLWRARAASTSAWDRPHARVAAWLLLAAASALVLVTPRFLPFYDYPEWLLQGQIVHDLLTGATSNGIPVSDLYASVPVPVPNLAAPAGIALLAFVLPIEAAGRVFLVIGVLGFAGGYAFLVRQWQGRATAMEFTGSLWAFGYFLQRGYVSYLFALPIAFVGIGLTHRFVHRPGGRRLLAGLVALQVLAFLAHLVAWGVLLVAVGCYAVTLYRGARRAEAAWLLASAAPTVVLLAWYTAVSRDAGHLAPYTSVRDKALSLVESMQFFLRLDPYPGVVPTFPAQLLVTVALVAVMGWTVRRRALRAALRTTPAAIAFTLAVMAVLDPIGNLNSLTKPDQRLLFPAVLLLLACLPWRPLRLPAGGAVVGVMLVALGLHGIALVSLDAPLQRAFDAIDTAVPADAAVTTVAVPADGGCRPGLGPSIGIPALKWFDVVRMTAWHQVRADLQETSAVVLRFDPRSEPGLTTLSVAAPAAAEAVRATAPAAYVEVFGCPADVSTVGGTLAPEYRPVVSGDGYAVLRR